MGRVLALLQAPIALLVLYLDILAVAATRWRPRRLARTPGSQTFVFLLPAHDEEALLPRLLQSIAALEYPRSRYDVCVVADNCTDRTADVARQAGAQVYERQDSRQQGKGYALQWLIAQLAAQGRYYDAYVVVDADSVVSPDLLSAFSACLTTGEQVIQCYYGVLNRDQSWPATLRYVALALYNGLRPRGRAALGLSAGLRGNGMCFSRAVLERFGWSAFTLAEDAEYHLALVAAGIRVAYAGEASVLAEMPVTLRQARSQNIRWERGRLQLLRTYGPQLLGEAIRRRDPIRLEALLEQLVPPLSIVSGLGALGFVVTTVAGARPARRLAGLVLAGQAGYVVAGLRLVEATPRAYLVMLCAPLYAVWKIWIYAIALLGRRDGRWVRTARRDADVA